MHDLTIHRLLFEPALHERNMMQLHNLAHHVIVDVESEAVEQRHVLCNQVVDVIYRLALSVTLIFREIGIVQPITLYERLETLKASATVCAATDKVIHSLGVEVIFSIALYAEVTLIAALKTFL
jgi:hypothetical protein